MSEQKNGVSKITTDGFSTDDKLDILVEGLSELTAKMEAILDYLAEVNEKLSNMSLPGSDFDIDDFEDES